MKQKNTTIKFKKSVHKTDDKQHENPQKEKIIEKFMERFNITAEEAEKILIKLEQDKQEKASEESAEKQDSIKTQQKTNLTKKEKDSRISKNKVKKFESADKITLKSQLNKSEKINDKKPTQKQEQKQQPQTQKPTQKQEQKQQPQTQEQQNVDDILTELIPNYHEQISVELNNVDLTFEVETEKVETIKESFINLVKRKKNDKLVIHALNDISFKIYQGEKVGIIGFNGAGKSTLLKVITGIYQPDSGEVNVNGMISPLLSLGAGFDRNYSGRKNIMLNGAVLGYDKEFLESKIDEIIEFSELGKYIDLPIKNYSSGMLAKLGFSIATLVEPDILIIDEILAVGDINFRKKSTDKMKSLMDSGSTLIFVSHSIPQVRELCDKAIWLENGKVKEIGEVNKVCEHYIKYSETATNEQLANIQFR